MALDRPDASVATGRKRAPVTQRPEPSSCWGEPSNAYWASASRLPRGGFLRDLLPFDCRRLAGPGRFQRVPFGSELFQRRQLHLPQSGPAPLTTSCWWPRTVLSVYLFKRACSALRSIFTISHQRSRPCRMPIPVAKWRRANKAFVDGAAIASAVITGALGVRSQRAGVLRPEPLLTPAPLPIPRTITHCVHHRDVVSKYTDLAAD